MKKKTICLNMIVKNESKVIQRCFDSIKHLIDYWVIVDTGSTDGTQKMIRELFKNIPGELHERAWVDFSTNRNEALALAKGKADYLLLIDADETLTFEKPLNKKKLTKNFYAVKNRDLTVDFYRITLIDQNPNWVWRGVLHEEITNSSPVSGEILENVLRVGVLRDGARAADSSRYLKDAAILEEALKKDPENPRTLFYLGQSYGSARKPELALQNYQKRAQMGGNAEEVFLSLYFSGCLREDLKKSFPELIKSYEIAYQHSPQRAEPLAGLARICLVSNQPFLSYLVAAFGLKHPRPRNCSSYIRREVYDYQMLFYLACSLQSLGKKSEAFACYDELLSKKELPDEVRETIKRNLLL